MPYKKQATKIEEKRGLAMGMARISRNDGKKTMKTIERQVESAKWTQDRPRRKMSQLDTRLCRAPPRT